METTLGTLERVRGKEEDVRDEFGKWILRQATAYANMSESTVDGGSACE